jgi:hypothetical protein
MIFLIGINIHAQRDRVQVQNGTLVTDSKTLLRGACYYTSSSYNTYDYWDGFALKDDISQIKKLGLNCLHIYHESASDHYPGERAELLDSIVKWTEQESLYLIITPAWWGGLESNFVYDFWSFYASRYNDKTHLIYEIANEPGDIPLDSLTMDMERRAYDTIRAYDENVHVLFITSGVEKANELIESLKYLGDSIDWGNASIAAHGYDWPSHNIPDFIQPLKDSGYAVTLTEFHSFENIYANIAISRMCEKEFISYIHFLPILTMKEDPSIYIDRFESSEVRWSPDFGEWPLNITDINYQSPYKTWKAAFYDDGAGWRTGIFGSILEYMRQDTWVAYFNLDFED